MIIFRYKSNQDTFTIQKQGDCVFTLSFNQTPVRTYASAEEAAEDILQGHTGIAAWDRLLEADRAEERLQKKEGSVRGVWKEESVDASQTWTDVSPCILIIENDADIRRLYKSELEDEGFRIIEAWDEQSALDTFNAGGVDLIVLDVHLGGYYGLKLLQMASAKKSKVPVILCTAYPCYRYDYVSWLADAFVLKNSDLSVLIKEVRRLLPVEVQH